MNIDFIVNKKTKLLTPSQNLIAVDGENLQSNIIFSFEDEFVDGIGRLEYEIDDNKNYIILNKENNTYTIPIKSILAKSGNLQLQLVITENETDEGIPIFKSEKTNVFVSDSINAVGEAPEGYDLWIDIANAKLLEMDNINIDADKIGKITSIIITYRDGTTKEVQIEDGIGLDYIWQGTSLGIKRENEQTYEYVDLKGPKGDAGAIKMLIVAELPQTGSDDTIYLVPLETPDIQGNNYAEYVYINGAWELLGKIGVQVDLTDYYTKQETYSKGEVDNLIPDLTDYVKNTDYATSGSGGVFKTSNSFATTVTNGYLNAQTKTFTEYGSLNANALIGKSTLENVITGKGLVSNTDYASTSTAGVIKTSSTYNSSVSQNGILMASVSTYSGYLQKANETFVSKGTLENVITGKDLTTKAYVDGLVGDINTALDTINGEVI